MSLECTNCQRPFTTKSNLTRHLRVVHNIELEREDIQPHEYNSYNYKCLEGCEISYKYNRDLRAHLKNEHDISMPEIYLQFPNSMAFENWLAEEEDASCVQFVHVTASKKKANGVVTYYLECSRTGNKKVTIDESARKRKLRKTGTFKLDRGCTSQIIVTKLGDSSYNVHYFKMHYGHAMDLDHLRLSKRDRTSIASKLMLGVPISNVLESVQNDKTNLHNRINLLQRKDILNIKKSLNLDLKKCEKNTNIDLRNIKLFVTECEQLLCNPIAYHNLDELNETSNITIIIMTNIQAEILADQSPECVIVCSTELVNCNFELVALFTIYRDDCFPVACMFTNNTDRLESCALFFTVIREKVGVIRAEFLLTDVKSFYAEAWRNVMAPICNYYSLPHIDNDWKVNLNKIICDESDVTTAKRTWVFDTLKVLQKIQSEEEFLDNLHEANEVLKRDEDFQEFFQYFTNQYCDLQQWALCYRQNINEKVPIMERILETYVDEQNRFDKIFHGVLRYIRDGIIDKIVNIEYLTSGVNIRHEIAMDRNYTVENCSNNIWTVLVANGTNTISYVIQKFKSTNCCEIVCDTCTICVHMFSCSCADFFTNNTICEHIHYICKTYFEQFRIVNVENTTEITNTNGEQVEEEEEEIIIEVTEQNEFDELLNKINSGLNLLRTKVTKLSNQYQLNQILNGIEELCELSEENVMFEDHSYVELGNQ